MMEIREARDKDTMSTSACLNRIMLKVEQESFCDAVKQELMGDFDYVQKMLGICPEEAAILSCVWKIVMDSTHVMMRIWRASWDAPTSSLSASDNILILWHRKES